MVMELVPTVIGMRGKPTFYEEIGRRLAELRRAKNFSQERLAERADIAASYVAHIEAGSRRPTLDVITRLADALEVEGWRLIADERLSLDEKAWEGAARKLAQDVRGLPADEIELLSAIARKFKAVARRAGRDTPR